MEQHGRASVVLSAAAVTALIGLVPGSPVPRWLLSVLILVAALVALRAQREQNDEFPREWTGYLTGYVCWGSMGALPAITDAAGARVVVGVGIAVGYVVFGSAIVWFHRTRVSGVDRDWMIDSTVVVTAIAIALWTGLGITRTAAQRLTPMEQAALATAGLIHLSFLTLTGRLLMITRWRALRPYFGTTAGVLAGIGSSLYFAARVNGVETPQVAFVLWALAAIALASVTLLPFAPYLREDLADHQRPAARFVVLAASLVVGAVALLWGRGVSVDETVPLGGAMLLCGLVLWRMHGLFRTNEESTQQLERLAAQQAALAELGRRSLDRVDVRTFVAWACERIRTVLHVDRCCILEIDAGGGRLVPVGPERTDACFPLDAPLPACRTAVTGEVMYVPDLAADDRFHDHHLPAQLTSTGSVSARISGNGGAYGVLHICLDEGRTLGVDEIEFVEAVADMLAVAVDRIEREDRIRHASLHDPLTGLPNRTLLFDRLDHALAGASRREGEVVLLFVDLDRFKDVNDRLGHVGGDELLSEVGRRLRGAVRASDTVARFGGDEFVVLAEGVRNVAAATRMAQSLAEAMEAPFEVQGQQLQVSGSVGIATAGPGATAEDLLRRADAAMYQAKARGGAHLQVAPAAS